MPPLSSAYPVVRDDRITRQALYTNLTRSSTVIILLTMASHPFPSALGPWRDRRKAAVCVCCRFNLWPCGPGDAVVGGPGRRGGGHGGG